MAVHSVHRGRRWRLSPYPIPLSPQRAELISLGTKVLSLADKIKMEVGKGNEQF
ncbi:MAG: hypothetical protein GY950_13675 [bacterium]|nr:hypothetical protein [bacterium]